MSSTVIQQLPVGTADGRIISHMVDTGAGPGGKTQDVWGFPGPVDGQKGHGGLRKASVSDVLKRNNDAGLKIDGKMLLRGIHKALFGGDADFFQGVWRLHFPEQKILGVLAFDGDSAVVSPVFLCLFHLSAAVQDSISNQAQFLNLPVNDAYLSL